MRHILIVILLATFLQPTTADATSFIKRLFGREDAPAAQQDQNQISEYKYLQDFMAESEEIIHTRFENSPITYRMRVPTGWEEHYHENGRFVPDERILRAMDYIRGPYVVGGERPLLEVQAVKLQHEILVEHWLQHYIFQNGYTQQGDLKIISETEGEATFVSFRSGVQHTARMRAFIIADNVITVSYDVPDTADNKIKEYGHHAVNSFEITVYETGEIEKHVDYSFNSDIRFGYPKSWSLERLNTASDLERNLELRNINSSQSIKGVIRLESLRKTAGINIKSAIDEFTDSLKQRHNLRIEALLNSAPLLTTKDYKTAVVERYEVGISRTERNDYEIWLVVLESDNWLNFIYMLTPNANRDYYEWARNSRTLDLIVHSIN